MSDVSKSLQEHRKSAYKFKGDLFDTLGLDVKKEEPVEDSEMESVDELSMDIPESNEVTVEEVSETEQEKNVETEDIEATVSEVVDEDTSSPFDDVEPESVVMEVSSVEELVSPGGIAPKVSEDHVSEEPSEVETTADPLNTKEKQLQEAILARTQAIDVSEVEVKTEGASKIAIDGLLLDAIYQRLQIDVKLDTKNRMVREIGGQYVMAYVLAEWLGWSLETLPEKLGWSESTISGQWAPLLQILKDKNVVTTNPIVDYIRSLETKISRIDQGVRTIGETNELSLIGYAHEVGSHDSVARTPKERMDTGLRRLESYRRVYYRNSNKRSR